MIHPIFGNRKASLIYSFGWILVASVHFVIMIWAEDLTPWQAGVDSLVFNLLFATIGIVLWYTVQFSDPTKSNTFNLILNHITLIVLVNLIWIAFGNFVAKSINANEFYTKFVTEFVPSRILTGVFLYFIIVLVYYLIMYYNDIQAKLSKEGRLLEMLKEGELNVLKSQINPHFLFNSLNSISSLTITNAEKAQEMIIKLSDFLRYTVSKDMGHFSSFTAELQNIQRYLEIEKIRFGNKMLFEFDLDDDCMDVKMPSMILQPLFENAVKHGVYESTEPIVINTSCRSENNLMLIVIKNNYEQDSIGRKGEGIGLKNIQERLRLVYKHDNLIKVAKTESEFEVTLYIPIDKNDDE
ncbi:MAG: hypothetical protein CL663_02220 [Bacteroidetes bacterium]|nr:hypothetical protein [Bacteroidota bacterium]